MVFAFRKCEVCYPFVFIFLVPLDLKKKEKKNWPCILTMRASLQKITSDKVLSTIETQNFPSSPNPTDEAEAVVSGPQQNSRNPPRSQKTKMEEKEKRTCSAPGSDQRQQWLAGTRRLLWWLLLKSCCYWSWGRWANNRISYTQIRGILSFSLIILNLSFRSFWFLGCVDF